MRRAIERRFHLYASRRCLSTAAALDAATVDDIKPETQATIDKLLDKATRHELAAMRPACEHVTKIAERDLRDRESPNDSEGGIEQLRADRRFLLKIAIGDLDLSPDLLSEGESSDEGHG